MVLTVAIAHMKQPVEAREENLNQTQSHVNPSYLFTACYHKYRTKEKPVIQSLFTVLSGSNTVHCHINTGIQNI